MTDPGEGKTAAKPAAKTAEKTAAQTRPAGEDEVDACRGVKTTASAVAGASLGVVAGIAGIATAAVFDIILPVALCLWATGLAGGAMGVLIGIGPKQKD